MSIDAPKNVPGSGDNGGTEGLTEEQKKKLAEEQAKAKAAKRDADIQGSLSGNKGASGAGGAGNGTQIFGNGAQGAGGFGYGGIFGNTSLNVDQEQLNDLTNKFFNYTMNIGSLPFGLGTQAMQNSFGAWFQAIMNCFQFTNTTTTVAGGGNFTLGSSQTVASSSGTTLIDKSKAPEGYENTATSGVFSRANKYYKYADGSYQLVECKADGTSLTEAAKTGNDAVEETQTKTETEAKTQTQTEVTSAKSKSNTAVSVASSQKDDDYQTYGNGNICVRKGSDSGSKDTPRYVKHNGQWVRIEAWGSNGSYKLNGSCYHSNGITTGQNINKFNNLLASMPSAKTSPDDLINLTKDFDKNTILDCVSDLDKSKYTVSTFSSSRIRISDANTGRLICDIEFDGNSNRLKSVERNQRSSYQRVSYTYDNNGGVVGIQSNVSNIGSSKETKISYGSDGSSTTTQSHYVEKRSGSKDNSYWFKDKEEVKNKAYNDGNNTSKPWTMSKVFDGQIPKIDASVAGYSSAGGDHISIKGGSLYKENDGSYRFVKGGETLYYDKDGNCTKKVISSDTEVKTYMYGSDKYSVTTEAKKKK